MNSNDRPTTWSNVLEHILGSVEGVKAKSSDEHDEVGALAHVLVELREIARDIDARITRIVEQGEKLGSAEVEEEIDEIQEQLRHITILIPLTRRFGFLLPPDP